MLPHGEFNRQSRSSEARLAVKSYKTVPEKWRNDVKGLARKCKMGVAFFGGAPTKGPNEIQNFL